MAKGKRSVALFEVIQSSRTSRSDTLLKTPKWWFKGRGLSGKTGSASSAPTIEGATAPPSSGEGPLDSGVPAPRTPGLDLTLDPDRQRITFQLSYTSAAVAAFAVIVILGLAIIIGQRMSRGPAPVMANATTDQIRGGPARAEVLNIGQATASARHDAAPSSPPPAAQRPKVETAAGSGPAPAAQPVANLAPTTSPNGQRVIGLNYCVVQSWPPEEKQLAYSACDLLKKNGIECTVELDAPACRKDWYAVVGLTGFERPRSDPKYQAYEDAIRALSNKFAGTSKFKQFAPFAAKWLKAGMTPAPRG